MSTSHLIPRYVLIGFTLLSSSVLAQSAGQAAATVSPAPTTQCVPYTYTGYPPKPAAAQLNPQALLEQARLCNDALQVGDAFQYLHDALDRAPEAEKPALWLQVQQMGQRLAHQMLEKVPDTSLLALVDREFILQFGNKEDAEKVWATTKGKSFNIPEATVMASTPTQLQIAVSDEALAAGIADFTVNFAAPSVTGLSRGAKVTIAGVFDSYTSTPIMLTMSGTHIYPPTPQPTIPKPGENHRARVSAPLTDTDPPAK